MWECVLAEASLALQGEIREESRDLSLFKESLLAPDLFPVVQICTYGPDPAEIYRQV